MTKRVIVNVLTAFNLLCGVGSIALAFEGYFIYAGLLLFLGSIFDFFDGFLARLLKAQSAFGREFDALADMVSFGIAPAALLYNITSSLPVAGIVYTGIQIVFLLYPLAAAIRLAMFNTKQRHDNQFSGLPSPAAGLWVASLPIMAIFAEAEDLQLILVLFDTPLFYVAASLILSIFMILPVKMISMKIENYALSANVARYILLLISVIILILFPLTALFFIVPLYIILSLTAKY